VKISPILPKWCLRIACDARRPTEEGETRPTTGSTEPPLQRIHGSRRRPRTLWFDGPAALRVGRQALRNVVAGAMPMARAAGIAEAMAVTTPRNMQTAMMTAGSMRSVP
jgi:hypothetical protein